MRPARTPWLIVPARVYARVQGVLAQRSLFHVAGKLSPIEYIAIEFWIDQALPGSHRRWRAHVRREFDSCIESDVARVGTFETLHIRKVNLADSVIATPTTPAIGRLCGLRQHMWSIHQQHRAPFDAQVLGIAHVSRNMRDKGQIVVRIMRLIDQDLVAAAIPAACPFSFAQQRQNGRVMVASSCHCVIGISRRVLPANQ